jgi:radical SAM superfamily enzyme YgiQ (UPF0313 family)
MTKRAKVDPQDTTRLKQLERHLPAPRAWDSSGVQASTPVVSVDTETEAKRNQDSLQRRHARGGDLRVHLVYPNSYWVGMSNLGFQAVYSLLANIPGVVVERGFLPEDLSADSVHGKAWRTFESSRPLADCDLLAFSLSFETDYPHLLKILSNARLLTPSAEERDSLQGSGIWAAPLILAGGTALTLNPEPVAEFLDLAFIGEAEEFIPELVAALREARAAREERLQMFKRLAQLEGMYVPRFYQPRYEHTEITQQYPETSGALIGYAQIPGVPTRPQRRFVKDLSKFPTYSQVLTPETEFRSMFLTETGRGCEMGCRFCVAGYIYRPVRKRSAESIADTVKIGLENSQAIGFVGAAVSSHKAIAKLAHTVAQTGARASLSSLMSQRVTKALAASLSESEYKTVALAPEAGSERLRFAAGKRVANAQVLRAAYDLAEAGIRGFKLYFICGLPTETDEDLDAIAELALEVHATVSRAAQVQQAAALASPATENLTEEQQRSEQRVQSKPWVQLSVNPFIPKASTPFQWEPMLELKILERKIKRIEKLIRGQRAVEMRFESPKESYFQALLSRGDRRVGRLLLKAEQLGKDWKWLLSREAAQALPEVPPIEYYTNRRFSFDECVPWSVVDSRIDPQLLKREALRAHQEVVAGPTPATLPDEVVECSSASTENGCSPMQAYAGSFPDAAGAIQPEL